MPSRSAIRFNLDAATQARLCRLADVRHNPADRLVQEAIEEFLDREERRQEFQQDAFAAWVEFQANGLYVWKPDSIVGFLGGSLWSSVVLGVKS